MTKLRLAALIVVVIAATGAGIGARSLAGAGDGIPPVRRNSTPPTPAPQLVATIAPGDAATVGIGMPVVVTLDGDVAAPKRAAVESRLTVLTNPPVSGAWHWMSPRELHWRPPTYWQAHTDVNVDANFDRL